MRARVSAAYQSRLDSGGERGERQQQRAASSAMRSRDRLPELRRRLEAAGSAGGAGVEPAAQAHPPHIKQILDEAERISGWLDELCAGTRRARSLLADPAFHADAGLQAQLDATVTSCNAVGLKICGALRELEARGSAGGERGAGGRMARLAAGAARRRLADALDQHHALLAAAREHQLRLLREQTELMNLSLSEEECEGLLDEEKLALFVDNVCMETRGAQLALREAEARRDELRRVERALVDVRDLFMQLATLVETQQDRIDTIYHLASQATSHVDDGQKQLLKGTVTRRKTRKKKLSLIICLSSGFLIVLLVLIFT